MNEDNIVKRKVEELLFEQEKVSEQAAEEDRKSLKRNTQRADDARIMRRALPLIPEGVDYENWIDVLEKANRTQRDALEQHFDLNAKYAVTSSSTASVSITVINRSLEIQGSNNELFGVRDALLENTGSLDGLALEVENEIRALGLDNGSEGKTASTLLKEAMAAFNMPVTDAIPVASSLVPLRSCVDKIIANLLKKRKLQDKVVNSGHGMLREKILAIGSQNCRDFITDEELMTWANQWYDLHDDLSGAKSKTYTRQKWAIIIRQTLLFLDSLLSGIDPSKLAKR